MLVRGNDKKESTSTAAAALTSAVALQKKKKVRKLTSTARQLSKRRAFKLNINFRTAKVSHNIMLRCYGTCHLRAIKWH